MKIQKIIESLDNSVNEQIIVETNVKDADAVPPSCEDGALSTCESDSSSIDDSNKEDLNEGRLGQLAFGNSLAMELYGEFYKDLERAIKENKKSDAQKLLNEFRDDINDLKSKNKRWYATFVDIQEKLLDEYQTKINELVEVQTEGIVEESQDSEVVSEQEFENNYVEAGWDEYDDDYYDLDDVELDRRHAALYGGDRMYCDCGTKRVADEDGYFYCPECEKYE